MSDRSNWPKHPPPRQLWFHYHPRPGKCKSDSDEIIPSEEGDLWPEPYFSKEDAEKGLEEHPVYKEDSDETIPISDDGWEVIGPYMLADPKRCSERDGNGVTGLQCILNEGHRGAHQTKADCADCDGTGVVDVIGPNRPIGHAICQVCNGTGKQ